MSENTRPTADLHIVVGYDGSPPASRALDSAAALMGGRGGRITAVYVAHLTSTAMLSADAVAEMETDFDEIEQDLRAAVADRLSGLGQDWGFERRQGLIADGLIAVARDIRDTHPGDVVVIVVGSSSHAVHRVVGSVAVNLARHSPVPLVVVP
jgi:nucleotide-binding universal stress UspA family protein